MPYPFKKLGVLKHRKIEKYAERTDLQISTLDKIFDIFENYFNLSYDDYIEMYDQTWSDVDNVIYNFEINIKDKG